ncbi:MAG TPA: hypothetical protein VN018_06875 [Brevundimonas sp.]|nr:hypothetical protein [Brevundimonas sp.]
MSPRRILADAHTALAVRRVQEQAALYGLQAQRQAEERARTELDARVRAQADSEAVWEAFLRGPVFDPVAEALWRGDAHAAMHQVQSGEEALAAEVEASRARRNAWARQLQLADAAQTVLRSAARNAARRDEAARLADAEDLLRSRGERS